MSDLTDLGNRIARAMQHMDAWDTPGDLIADLADEGLALVPAAEVPTPEERAVLEASLAYPEHWLGSSATIVRGHHKQLEALSWAWEQAVLRLHEARRAAKEAKG